MTEPSKTFETLEPNLDRIQVGDQEIFLVGTAHISKKSVELAERTIRTVQPDTVAIELCDSRWRAIQDPHRWRNTDIMKVIREGRVNLLVAQLLLSAFQKRLGDRLEVKPGTEMIRAAEVAKEINANLCLADREVKITLKRTWAGLSLWSLSKITAGLLAGIFSKVELSEEELERMKSADVLESMMTEFTGVAPGIHTPLIDERDRYMAATIRACGGKRIVAIVGAGHVSGMKRYLHEHIDRAPLEVIPPPSFWKRAANWSIPVLVAILFILGFFFSGGELTLAMAETWVFVTAISAATGAALALAHPLSVLAAAFSAPFTTLHPLLASGFFSAFVEAWIRKPLVSDLEHVLDDATTVRGFFRNRLTRILLVFMLTNLCGSIGMLVGVPLIAALL
jgi:pheromone shutdown-related protein TraB